jgi:hypothetical protein
MKRKERGRQRSSIDKTPTIELSDVVQFGDGLYGKVVDLDRAVGDNCLTPNETLCE